MRCDSDLAIIAVDGGISSQIAFVAYGMFLKEKFGERIRVEYDLSWYRRFGCDGNGRFARNWDMPKAFPKMAFPEADQAIAAKWSRWFRQHDLHRVESLFLPAYLDGYPPEREACVYRYREQLQALFHPALSAGSSAVASRIEKSGHVCGVHVRRGDLATGNPGYGKATSVEYYVAATAIIHGIDPRAEFLFFSEEPEWVSAELLPRLPEEYKAEIVAGNGSDRGYEDLYLLAQCDYIISSIGSFGPMAAMLSRKYKWLVMSRRRPGMLDWLDHCIYVNDDRRGFGCAESEAGDGDVQVRKASWRSCVVKMAHIFWARLRHCTGLADKDDYWLAARRIEFKYRA